MHRYLPLLLGIALLAGCQGRSVGVPPGLSASPWVGSWTEGPEREFQRTIGSNGEFRYEFWPSMSTAPNPTVYVFGSWSALGDSLRLHALWLRYRWRLREGRTIRPGDILQPTKPVNVTLDVLPRNHGKILRLPFALGRTAEKFPTDLHRISSLPLPHLGD